MSDEPNQRKIENRSFDFPEYMRPRLAAQYIGHSESTLAKLRMRHNQGCGPLFAKRGGLVLYRRSDLDAWIASHFVSLEG